jgi:hypothetical protein
MRCSSGARHYVLHYLSAMLVNSRQWTSSSSDIKQTTRQLLQVHICRRWLLWAQQSCGRIRYIRIWHRYSQRTIRSIATVITTWFDCSHAIIPCRRRHVFVEAILNEAISGSKINESGPNIQWSIIPCSSVHRKRIRHNGEQMASVAQSNNRDSRACVQLFSHDLLFA